MRRAALLVGGVLLVWTAHAAPGWCQTASNPTGDTERIPASTESLSYLQGSGVAEKVGVSVGAGFEMDLRRRADGLRLDGDRVAGIVTLALGLGGRVEFSAVLPSASDVAGGRLGPPLVITGSSVERLGFGFKLVLWKRPPDQNGASLAVAAGGELPVFHQQERPPGDTHRYHLALLGGYRFGWGIQAVVNLRMAMDPGWDFRHPHVDTVGAGVGVGVPLWAGFQVRAEARLTLFLDPADGERRRLRLDVMGGVRWQLWPEAAFDFGFGGDPTLGVTNILVMSVLRLNVFGDRPVLPSAPSPLRADDEGCNEISDGEEHVAAPRFVADRSGSTPAQALDPKPCMSKDQARRYVDFFTDVQHDARDPLRVHLSYRDGTAIDLDLRQVGEEEIGRKEFLGSIKRRRTGDGKRVFPERMNRSTTPRLWAEKHRERPPAPVPEVMLTPPPAIYRIRSLDDTPDSLASLAGGLLLTRYRLELLASSLFGQDEDLRAQYELVARFIDALVRLAAGERRVGEELRMFAVGCDIAGMVVELMAYEDIVYRYKIKTLDRPLKFAFETHAFPAMRAMIADPYWALPSNRDGMRNGWMHYLLGLDHHREKIQAKIAETGVGRAGVLAANMLSTAEAAPEIIELGVIKGRAILQRLSDKLIEVVAGRGRLSVGALAGGGEIVLGMETVGGVRTATIALTPAEVTALAGAGLLPPAIAQLYSMMVGGGGNGPPVTGGGGPPAVGGRRPVAGLRNGVWGRPRGGGGSAEARAYARKVTGSDESVYIGEGEVEFDGFRESDKTLIDAKLASEEGSFYDVTRKDQIGAIARRKLIEQAKRQISVLPESGAMKIEWHFSDKNVAKAVSDLFKGRRWKLEIVYTPR